MKTYPLHITGIERRQLSILPASPLTSPGVLVDGFPAPKGKRRNVWLLQRDDGAEVIIQLRNINLVDPVPVVVVDGRAMRLAPPFQWYETIWASIPLGLILVGGLAGGFFGALAAAVNGWVFRMDLPLWQRFLFSGLVTLTGTGLYFGASYLFSLISFE